jgi:uncharacterized protein YndB with AHSA1/START domain
MGSFSKTTTIDAPKDKVWAVLADIGSIEKWSPGVTHSHSTSAEPGGEGATRHCDVGMGGKSASLEERAFEWREGEGYKIDVYESSMPMKSNVVTFALKDAGSGTTVTVSPDYKMKFGPIGAMMDTLMVRKQFEKGVEGMLSGLKQYVETGEES